ncbi:O-antigen ligase family protein [Halobacillus seohaensis]|uniref:O-antigen ligase family protein n=1 Tax=Halobacillus seohaensis TaxID=447421 RepID=A0ABW2ERE2_9BACI
MQHGKNTHRFNRLIEIYLVTFILLQPLLDVTAYINLPISEPVRVLTLFLGLVYILLSPHNRAKVMAISYIVLLGIFMSANLVNNFVVKDPFSLMTEMTYIIKTSYFLIMLIIYYFVFKSLSGQFEWRNTFQKYVTINLAVIGFIMLLASLTDTGNRSYGMLDKEGHSGWFYSGNEVSAILGIGFAVMILYLMKQPTVKKSFLLLPSVIVTSWAILTVGTKVGVGSLLMVLALGSIIALFEIWKKRKWFNAILLPTLLVLSIFAVPFTAVGNNLGLTAERMDQVSEGENADDDPNNNSETEDDEDTNSSDRSAQARELLSSRDVFLAEKIDQYKEAPISQKLLGMGRGGNYKEKPSLVEMDILDWFLNFGILGFIVLVIPIVFFLFMIMKHLVISRFSVLNGENLFVGIAVAIGCGTAFLAGHVLSSPASGIYLALLMAYLYRSTKPMQRVSKK